MREGTTDSTDAEIVDSGDQQCQATSCWGIVTVVKTVRNEMFEQHIRTTSYVRLVQCRSQPMDMRKPRYSSAYFYSLSNSPMRIRYCRFEDIKNRRVTQPSINKELGVCIGQTDYPIQKGTQYSDKSMSNHSSSHWTTRTYTSWVKV